jgi:outer membrane lipoprotein-sorting protein
MRSGVWLGALALLLAGMAALAAVLPAAVPPRITSMRCEYRLAGHRVAAGKVMVYYVPPDKYRIEYPGGIVFLRDEFAAYRYSKRLKTAIRFPPGEPLFAPVNPAFLDVVIKASRKEGREQISGKMCDVYVLEKALSYGKPGTKVWVWPQGRVVLKTNFGGPAGGVSYILTKLKFNEQIPDSKFTLPVGTVVKGHTPPQHPRESRN